MIKAIAWDIDGTLVDSEPLHLKSLLSVCKKYGVDISDLPDEYFIGVNLHGVWKVLRKRFPANLEFNKWVDQINEFYFANSSSLAIMPHAIHVITQLDILGLSQIAVSNSNRCIVDINLDILGISQIMSFSLSLDDFQKGKPDPLPYQIATKKLGLMPNEILAVEDSDSGIASARNAGLKIIAFGVKGGPELYVDFSISSLQEVIQCVQKENPVCV